MHGDAAVASTEGEMTMTTVPELACSIGERLQISASARTMYGDPVTVGGRTVIPIARVVYGYGFGAGRNRGTDSTPDARPGGLGGGAGMLASPVGALEITDAGTRFIRFIDPVRLGIILALAVMLGMAIGRRSLR